jgi:uncharacterized DUF497 family protein
MKIDFDPAKDQANIEKHGCSLALAERLEWDGAYSRLDARRDYGEYVFQPWGISVLDFSLSSIRTAVTSGE